MWERHWPTTPNFEQGEGGETMKEGGRCANELSRAPDLKNEKNQGPSQQTVL